MQSEKFCIGFIMYRVWISILSVATIHLRMLRFTLHYWTCVWIERRGWGTLSHLMWVDTIFILNTTIRCITNTWEEYHISKQIAFRGRTSNFVTNVNTMLSVLCVGHTMYSMGKNSSYPRKKMKCKYCFLNDPETHILSSGLTWSMELTLSKTSSFPSILADMSKEELILVFPSALACIWNLCSQFCAHLIAECQDFVAVVDCGLSIFALRSNVFVWPL